VHSWETWQSPAFSNVLTVLNPKPCIKIALKFTSLAKLTTMYDNTLFEMV
jgi:hypothetical protein